MVPTGYGASDKLLNGETQQGSEASLLGAETTTVDETHDTSLASDLDSKPMLTFNSGPRAYRDTLFAFLFIATVLTTYAIGFVAVKNADVDLRSKLQLSRYNPTSGQCEVTAGNTGSSSTQHVGEALQGRSKAGDELRPTSLKFWIAILWTLGPIWGTTIMVAPAGFYILRILPRYNTTCAFVGVKEWSRVHVDVFGVVKSASDVLRRNLALLGLYPVLVLGMILIDAPIFTFLTHAFMNGKISPDFHAIEKSHDGCRSDTSTGQSLCCQIEQPKWILPYSILAAVTQLWVVIVTIFLYRFVVTGAIAEYRVAAPKSSESTVGFTIRSLRNALGPSFGTICMSTSFMTPALTMLNYLTRNRARFAGIFQLVKPFPLAYPCRPFSTRKWKHSPCEVAAVSGDSFFSSARISYADLSRQSTSVTAEVELVMQAVRLVAFVSSCFYAQTVLLAMYCLTTASWGDIQRITQPWCSFILYFGLFPFHSVIREHIVNASYCNSDHDEEQNVKASIPQ